MLVTPTVSKRISVFAPLTPTQRWDKGASTPARRAHAGLTRAKVPAVLQPVIDAQKGHVLGLLREAARRARYVWECDAEFGPTTRMYEERAQTLATVVTAARDDRAPLISALRDADPGARAVAAEALGHLFAREAEADLRTLQHDEDTYARNAIQTALAWISGLPESSNDDAPPGLPSCATLLCTVLRRHPHREARTSAARQLAGIAAAVPVLRAATADAVDTVRTAACEALAATPCAEALDALRAAVVDRLVIAPAIDGIARLWSSVRSDAALEAVLSRVAEGDSHARWAIARLTGQETDAARMAQLADYVEREVEREVEAFTYVRIDAAYRIAAALPIDRVAVAVARGRTSPRDAASFLKRRALDACGALADAALLAAMSDASLSEAARRAAHEWAIERGLVTPPPGALATDAPFLGEWQDAEGRRLSVNAPRGLTTRTQVELRSEGQGNCDLGIVKAEGEVEHDGFLRFDGRSFQSGWCFARCALRRKGSLLMMEVTLVGTPPASSVHPLAWLTPPSPFHRVDLPTRSVPTQGADR